jgi:hypothetical protein
MCMYVQLYVGMSRHVVGQMLDIFHYFLIVVRPHGLMVHSVNNAPGDGCSSHKYQSCFVVNPVSF